MAERVPVADWGAIETNLRRFAPDVDAHGSKFVARFTVARDGHVTAGMPLREFDGHVDSVVFDHDAGVIRIERAGLTYVFRRP